MQKQDQANTSDAQTGPS